MNRIIENTLHRAIMRLCLLLLFVASIIANSQAADSFAKDVVFSEILNGNVGNSQTNVANALGAPDGVYVSLGGPGASLLVDMGADTPVLNGSGPDLEVREIGLAFGGVDESYRVLVSNSPDTNTFVFVAVGRALSLIDIQPSGFSSARYIWLQDLATESLNSTTPGSDIDSLRALYSSGTGNNIAPPTDVAVRPTGQGAWLSWSPSTATNITGYAIRRSLDGVSFGSSPDVTVTAQETAWHDLSLPVVDHFYYAVNAQTGSGESDLVVASISVLEIPLMTNRVAHIGDDLVAGWEVPDPERGLELAFDLAGFGEGPQAELLFDLWDVDNSTTRVLLNGGRIGSLPIQPAESWAARSLRFPAGALQPGTNTLILGGATGTLDDFQMRNIALRLYGVQAGAGIITSAKFTQILPGQTNVTLRWVVRQTPTLSPVTWQTVSDPIEWTGAITSSNGFFRLQELP